MKKIIYGIIFVGIIAILFAASNKQWFKSIGINFKLYGASASANIQYQEQRTKQGNDYNYTATFRTPVGAMVNVNTLSADTVAITSVKQQDDKTIVIIEPINTRR